MPLDDENIKGKLAKRLLGYDNNKNYMEWLVNDYGVNDFITEYNSYSFKWFIGAYKLLYHNGEYAGLNKYMGIDKNYYLTTTVSDDVYMKKLEFNKNVYNQDKLSFSFFRNSSNHLMIINHPSVFINGNYTKQHLFIMISKTNNNSGMPLNKIPDLLKAISRMTPYSDKQDKIDEYIAKPCYHDDDNYDWLTIIPYECESCGKTMISWCNKNTPFTFIDYPPRGRKRTILDIQYDDVYSIIRKYYNKLPLNCRKNKNTYAKYAKFAYVSTEINIEDCRQYTRILECPYCGYLFPLQDIIDKYNMGEGFSISYLKTHDMHNMSIDLDN